MFGPFVTPPWRTPVLYLWKRGGGALASARQCSVLPADARRAAESLTVVSSPPPATEVLITVVFLACTAGLVEFGLVAVTRQAGGPALLSHSQGEWLWPALPLWCHRLCLHVGCALLLPSPRNLGPVSMTLKPRGDRVGMYPAGWHSRTCQNFTGHCQLLQKYKSFERPPQWLGVFDQWLGVLQVMSRAVYEASPSSDMQSVPLRGSTGV